ALDNALVPSEKRLKIERCNARIMFSKPQREETYQVTLDALKLSSCYPAFLVTTEVPEIYMHQFWNTITKIRDTDAYSFKLDKKKCRVDTESQADNREISSARKEHMPYPRFTKVIISDFISKDKTMSIRNMINLHTIPDDSLLGTLKFVSKTQDYQQYGALIPDDMINQDIKDSKAYKTYYDFATRKVPPRKARKYKKVTSPSRKLSPVKEAEPVKKAKRVKRPAKKSTTAPTAGVVIRDTPSVSVSKKKAPLRLIEVKMMETDFESGDPYEQQRKTSGTNEGTSTTPGVPDAPNYQSESDDESWGDNEDDDDDFNDEDGDDDNVNDDDNANDEDSKNEDDNGNDAHDSERTDSDDDDENPSFTLKDYDKEEHNEEYESDDDNENVFKEEDGDLYKDVDVRSLGAEQEKESCFYDECQEESSTQAPSLFTVPETAIPKTSIAHATTVPPTISMIIPLPQLTTPYPAPITVPTTTTIPAPPDFSSLFHN
ncbi:hypothetical protein Tco_0871010, partial [Tanacetum coccineum]